jgi:hypothetical protein
MKRNARFSTLDRMVFLIFIYETIGLFWPRNRTKLDRSGGRKNAGCKNRFGNDDEGTPLDIPFSGGIKKSLVTIAPLRTQYAQSLRLVMRSEARKDWKVREQKEKDAMRLRSRNVWLFVPEPLRPGLLYPFETKG